MSDGTPQTSLPLSILIPVWNEGESLRVTIKILEAVVEVPHEVLVIYDFPEDNSIPVVRDHQAKYPNVKLLHNTLGNGVGNAIRAGVQGADGETVVILLADDIGPMTSVSDMYALIQDGCDFVSCTRYARGGLRLGGSRIGYALSWTANRLLHLFLGCVFSDATTGIKMFRRSLYHDVEFESRPVGWAVVFEMALKAQVAGYRLGETPIISIDRLYGGKSTFNPGPWVKEYLRWFFWGVRNLRKNRHKMTSPLSVRNERKTP